MGGPRSKISQAASSTLSYSLPTAVLICYHTSTRGKCARRHCCERHSRVTWSCARAVIGTKATAMQMSVKKSGPQRSPWRTPRSSQRQLRHLEYYVEYSYTGP